MVTRGRRYAGRAVAAAVLLLLAGCGDGPVEPSPGDDGLPGSSGSSGGSSSGAPSGSPSGSPSGTGDPAHAVPTPGPLEGRLWQPDLLVLGAASLTDDVVARIAALPGVTSTERLSVAQVGIENGVITIAAVDPATYRRYTPLSSARSGAIWTRVALGQLALTPGIAKRLADRHGTLRLGNDVDAPSVAIGALAPQIPRVDAVVNDAWGAELGMPVGNALLVSTGIASPQSVRPSLEKVLDGAATVQILGPDPDITVEQPAFLTGGSVATAVGSFSYRILDHGRIAPDPAWVAANIRTERVPILGAVTCHRVLFPQLRAALTEVVDQGLAEAIHPEQFAGCYYPRFIAGTHELSLHAFGIAVDLNVPENQRGTPGLIDRRVVAIFQRWGFTWGGTWGYTDPMHFELNALVGGGG